MQRSKIPALVAAAVLLGLGLPGAAQARFVPRQLNANFGWVLSSPRIHNLFWADDWNAHNLAFPLGLINSFTAALAPTGYFNGAAQYGVGAPRFRPNNWYVSSRLCGPRLAPATVTSLRVLAWVTCEIVTPGTGVPYPSPRAPVSNDLYVVYLPQGTTISDDLTIPRFTVLGHTFGPYVLYSRKSCFDYGAYHFVSFGAHRAADIRQAAAG